MGHYPGPWRIDGNMIMCGDFVVAEVCKQGSDTAGNARLLAAAPDLLHMLYTALTFVEDALDEPAYKKGAVAKVVREIKAVLAKAEAQQ